MLLIFSFTDVKVECGLLNLCRIKMKAQQLSLYFLLTEVEQSTFIINISEGKDQQYKEVFPCKFDEPIADYLDSMSIIYVKIFLSDESLFYHLFKPLLC